MKIVGNNLGRPQDIDTLTMQNHPKTLKKTNIICNIILVYYMVINIEDSEALYWFHGCNVSVLRNGTDSDESVHDEPPHLDQPGRAAQSVACLTKEPEVLGSIPSLVTYFRFSFP